MDASSIEPDDNDMSTATGQIESAAQGSASRDSKTADDVPPHTNTVSSTAVEFEPPLASVKRLLKQTLPSNAIISKDAVSAVTRACGIFIIYITACANDCARENKRNTISANDILAAIKVQYHFIESTISQNAFSYFFKIYFQKYMYIL